MIGSLAGIAVATIPNWVYHVLAATLQEPSPQVLSITVAPKKGATTTNLAANATQTPVPIPADLVVVSDTPNPTSAPAVSQPHSTSAPKTSSAGSATKSVTTSTPTPTPAPTTTPTPMPTPSIQGQMLFADASIIQTPSPVTTAWTQLSANPQALWLGNWQADSASVARNYLVRSAATKALGVLVLYNIPQRDCGSYSAGGSNSPQAYQNWVTAVANSVQGTPAVVIVEPDALAQISCLSADDLATRYHLLNYAVTAFHNADSFVYLDGGNSSWVDPSVMAGRLRQSGIATANGFSLNVSNFRLTGDEVAYGTIISALTDNKHFVIDTSRNGNGPTADNQWCNPSGRKVGTLPTTSTGLAIVDAYLWVKHPGESDGTCNGGPTAGAWWNDYATSLLGQSSSS